MILDLTHLSAWEDSPWIWKHEYYLPAGDNLVVVCNLTDGLGSVAFNVVKWVGVDVAWIMISCFRGVTHD